MESLRKKVHRFIQEHDLCKPGDRLVVAYSGGADSTALLDILASLPGYDLTLVMAHLNHLLRGDASEEDEIVARSAAVRYGCRFVTASVDVASLAKQKGLSLEEAGREARYTFFYEVAGKYSAAAVALGHHKDDQAETVLMRLLRGAGGSGLSGMRPERERHFIVRPLLCLTRQEIEVYLRKAGLTWREDGSNSDKRFLRNRIRHELLPYLETFNPDIVECLNRTAEVLAADEDLLDIATRSAFQFCFRITPRGAEGSVESLRSEPSGLRKRLYRKAIESVKGDLRRISFIHLAETDGLMAGSRPNGELTLPSGVRVIRSYDSLVFTLQQDDSFPAEYELVLDCPGTYELPCGSILLVEVYDGPMPVGGSNGACEFIFPKRVLPLKVRYFRNGDRMIPVGMNGHKKLKNLFIDRKIPQQQRRRIPLVVDRDEIVWVCGVQATEMPHASVAADSMTRLRMTYTAVDDRY
jgi:tRNA(Ile)-lysidine synthase